MLFSVKMRIYINLSFFRFKKKTCNKWADRFNFKKVEGKYDMLHMDYTAEVPSTSDYTDGVKTEKKVC